MFEKRPHSLAIDDLSDSSISLLVSERDLYWFWSFITFQSYIDPKKKKKMKCRLMPIFTRVFPFWGKGIIGTFYFLPASTCEYRTSKSSSPTQGNIYGFFLKAYDYFHLRSGLRQNNNTLFKPPWDLKEGVDGFAFKGCTHDCYECIRFLLKAPEMRPLSRVHGQFPRRGNNYDQNLRFDGLPTVAYHIIPFGNANY